MKNQLKVIYEYILPLGIFFIPIYIQFFTYSVIIFLFLSLSKINFPDYLYQLKKYALFFVPMWAYFIYDAVGLIWTNPQNIPIGIFDLEVKFSLFAIPFILIIYNHFFNIQKLISAFIYGCLISSIFLLLRMTYFYVTTHHLLIYTDFSLVHHTSYYTWYLNFATIFVIHHSSFTNKFKYLFVIVFLLTSYLCLSKVGLFNTSLIATYIFINSLKKLKLKYQVIITIIFISSFSILIYFTRHTLKSRFIETLDLIENFNQKTSVHFNYLESNSTRIVAWKNTIKIIQNNFWFGAGTGDFKDELNKYYISENYYSLAEKNINAHNQFIQDFAKLGIIHLLLLISIFIFLFIQTSSSNYKIFFFITFINFLFESMLETQSGTIFFSFTTTLTILTNFTSAPSNKTNTLQN